ncbi:MAG: hypothetical protein GY861_09305 [bacterium]|nr:hypothetical protein [bacterium]
MKKIIAILSILVLVFIGGCTDEQPIGGETDDHGCLGAAGYTYDEDIQACVRDWELNDNQAKAAKIAVESLDVMGEATINEVVVARCPGCFVVDVKLHSYDKNVKVNLADWEVVKPPKEEIELSPEDCEAKGGRPVNIVGGDSCNDEEVTIGPVVGFISPNICCIPGERLTEEEAINIAKNSECVKEGSLTDKIMYNEDTDTYWIDLNLEQPGCNPACVVYEAYKKATINYRCTGALPPKE